MRYIMVLGFTCISLCYSFGIVNAAGRDPFPYDKGGFNVTAATTWGNEVYTGNVFFVDSTDSNARDDTAHGMKRSPFATLDFAVGRCTASNGDLIVALPGHIENVNSAGDLDLDVAGITLIGVGHGNLRPTIRFLTTHTTDMDVDATNITMQNFLFEMRYGGDMTQINTHNGPIDVNATDTTFINIETRDVFGVGSTTNWIVCDAEADRFTIRGWKHVGTLTLEGEQPVSALYLVGQDDVTIEDFNVYGNFVVAGIMVTDTACTRLNIRGGSGRMSQVWTENATDTAINAMESTGIIGPNIIGIAQDDAANLKTLFRGRSMYFINPLPVINAVNESSTQTMMTRSTDA